MFRSQSDGSSSLVSFLFLGVKVDNKSQPVYELELQVLIYSAMPQPLFTAMS